MVGDGRAVLEQLIGRALEQGGWDPESAAERLLQAVGEEAACILALDRLADLTEEASRLADSPEQAATLLRLRVRYRSEAGVV
jgi:hypothetical protein